MKWQNKINKKELKHFKKPTLKKLMYLVLGNVLMMGLIVLFGGEISFQDGLIILFFGVVLSSYMVNKTSTKSENT